MEFLKSSNEQFHLWTNNLGRVQTFVIVIDFRKNWHLWHSVSINVRHQNQIRVIYLLEEQYSAYHRTLNILTFFFNFAIALTL